MSGPRRLPVAPHALAGLALALAAFAPQGARAQQAAAATAVQGGEPPRAARTLPRGTVIAAGDIVVLGDSLPPDLPIGWVTRRVVQEGEPLRRPAIGRTPVVHTGQEVTLRAGSTGVSVARRGAALEDGAPGDTIRIRFDRGTTIAAIVRDGATVLPVLPIRP